MDSLINPLYLPLLLNPKKETINPTYDANIGSFVSYFNFKDNGKVKSKEEEEKNQQPPYNFLFPKII